MAVFLTLVVSLSLGFTVRAAETSVDKGEDGSVTQGASDLKMKSASKLGEDMFEIAGGEGEKETKIKFGFAQIVELDSNGDVIEADKHACSFHKDNVTCTTSQEEKGSMSGVDEEGEPTDAEYTRITKTCALSSCNSNANAAVLVRSYIMLNKAYICQPDCEAEDQFQSPVFNGTAKWEVEVQNWEFCTANTCAGKEATDMKIFFAIRGSKGGKEMKPKKKGKVPFDQTKGKSADKCKKKSEEADEETDKPAEDSNQGGDSSPNKRSVLEKRDGTNDTSTGKDTDGAGRGDGAGKKGDRKGKGKCRNSLSSSFGDEPDDQDEFALADDTGAEDGAVLRMFGMAVVDGSTVLSDGAGFVGPVVESAEFSVGDSSQTKTRDYVTIQVSKFETKLVYDPTVDMDSTGGSNGDYSNGARSVGPTILLMLSTLLTFAGVFA